MQAVRRPGTVWVRVPLGLALLALDLPFLRAPLARALAFINRKLAPAE